MTEFDLIRTAASAMAAERSALDVYARNVAAAGAQTADGAFVRLIPRLELDERGDLLFAGARRTAEPAQYRYDPRNPFAERSGVHRGFVAVSPLDVLGEMVAALDAGRAYESGAALFDLGKRLAERTIELERA